jgi:membrane protein CcdC involved in cytochrome C biogenesis
MISPLSLSNLATVIFAVVCLWVIAAQARGNVVKLWRLAIPACFAAVVAFMLLASVFDADLESDAEWLIAAAIGIVLGRMRGWAIALEVDQRHDLVRQQGGADGPVVAIGLVLLASTDFALSALQEPLIEPQHVAAAAALCAGYLCGRALAIAVRTARLPHVELHRA